MLLKENPKFDKFLLISVPAKLLFPESDWLPSNKDVPFILGLPKYPTIIAPPIF